ncbi:MAG TPA: DUF1540 domain-containing protein [Lachnospiraceae bacterium]|nr:DUF1540 domain-containing protein [Lachnospiraceae bacterium]
MAELNCGVSNCFYNKNSLCSKGDIMVGGKQADVKDQTSCESFSNREQESYTSSLDHASKVISIDCEASKCTYNNNYRCIASQVDVTGNGAKGSKETSCSTFVQKTQ